MTNWSFFSTKPPPGARGAAPKRLARHDHSSGWAPEDSDAEKRISLWDMGVSIVMGVPQNAWFIMENPTKNGWFRGTPILGNPHINVYLLVNQSLEPLLFALFCLVKSCLVSVPLWFSLFLSRLPVYQSAYLFLSDSVDMESSSLDNKSEKHVPWMRCFRLANSRNLNFGELQPTQT